VPSPDGKLLAFREPTFGLSLLDIASGETRRVQQPVTLAAPPFAWSADGAALLYLLRADGAAQPTSPSDLVRFDLASGTTAVVVAGVRGFDLLASPE
jgi:hypothetical protein